MPGFAAFDLARHEYTVIGSGDDIYGTTDAFHFLWRKISSDDMALSASVALVGSSGINNRQAGLMIRQGLAQDDAYAGVMIHGTGQIVLKFRPTGGMKSTNQSVADQTMPQSMRVELHGKHFRFFLPERISNSSLQELRSSTLAVPYMRGCSCVRTTAKLYRLLSLATFKW
jgi:TolB protein